MSSTDRAALPAGDAILDTPDAIPAIWGEDDSVLWAQGEGLMICGPQGVGKTTLLQQLALAAAGIGPPGLLGYPVRRLDGIVVYCAMDRPAQALRSMRRMIDEHNRQALNERMLIWPGPLPFNVLTEPTALAEWLVSIGARAAFFDSVKDMAVGLASDEVGAAVNIAMQHALAAGIDMASSHHQRKQPQGERKPRGLDDVYGSTWLTSGQGSVLMLWGEAGDSYIEMHHLKQPDGIVGPLKIEHDHVKGRSIVTNIVDALEMARRTGGVTARDLAGALNDTIDPDKNQQAQARRRLDKLVKEGALRAEKHTGAGPDKPTVYFPANVVQMKGHAA